MTSDVLAELHRRAQRDPVQGENEVAHYGDPAQEDDCARRAAGLIDLSTRTKIELSGADRARFLHNLCTNEIRALATGRSCEAFVTSVQAKIVGHVFVFATPHTLILDTVPGQWDRLHAHLVKYHITEDVQVTDRTAAWAEWLLAGPKAAEVLQSVGVSPSWWTDATPLQHGPVELGRLGVWMRRWDLLGELGFVFVGPSAAAMAEVLLSAGAAPLGMRVFHTLRIEAGVPYYGRDISDEQLPQEVGRDRQAISFTKGCYLGQETVARIDAYGHVNRHLVGLRLREDRLPPAGAEIVRDDRVIGHITSAACSPRLGVIALAYVRRGNHTPGSEVTLRADDWVGSAEVSGLPFAQS